MGNAVCSISECERPAVARSWCRAHWKHWRRWGDPTYFQTEKPRKPIGDRFWSKVDAGEGCWEWKASRDALGYGFFRVTTRESMKKAHRVAWELTNGPIPDGLVVCHRCDNPPCVRPDHLFLGSLSDNTQDSIAKGRWNVTPTHYGETSPLSKLTAEQVDAIRHRYATGGIRQRELAEEYGVQQSTISKIVRGVRWKQAA